MSTVTQDDRFSARIQALFDNYERTSKEVAPYFDGKPWESAECKEAVNAHWLSCAKIAKLFDPDVCMAIFQTMKLSDAAAVKLLARLDDAETFEESLAWKEASGLRQ